MTDFFQEFDRYVDEQHAAGSTRTVSELFGQFLANTSGSAIIGGPVGEAPSFVATPEDSND